VSEPLKILVGSDRWQQAAGAEKVLEHSIKKHATCEVQMVWMRSGDPPLFATSEHGTPGTWKLGRPVDHAWPKKGWGTPFSSFRFAIPELMGFKGRAVYMDADMIVLGDVKELRDRKLTRPWTCIDPRITDVSIIDCSYFTDPRWPRIESMRPSGCSAGHYVGLLQQMGWIDPTLSPLWNCRDGVPHDSWYPSSKLLHFTTVPTQPYCPYPSVSYKPHPWPTWSRKWNAEFAEAHAATR
jgi:hypothetical protein